MLPLAPRARCARPRGFSLVEIMFAVLIIGLLVMLGLPAFQRSRTAAQSNRFVADLRTFAQAFENFSLQTGQWPASAGPGSIPGGMEGEIKSGAWGTHRNSIGGRWSWEQGNNGITAAIAITDVTAPEPQMLRIDARMDDGDLSTGIFRRAGTTFLYVLQE